LFLWEGFVVVFPPATRVEVIDNRGDSRGASSQYG
jgi:hypothetical protein